MRDSCVVYVNEALDYYFSFIFIYFRLFSFISLMVLKSVLLILPLHNKSEACNVSDS